MLLHRRASQSFGLMAQVCDKAAAIELPADLADDEMVDLVELEVCDADLQGNLNLD